VLSLTVVRIAVLLSVIAHGVTANPLVKRIAGARQS
jgi:hypothetical protein